MDFEKDVENIMTEKKTNAKVFTAAGVTRASINTIRKKKYMKINTRNEVEKLNVCREKN